jgi:hypothetical protein
VSVNVKGIEAEFATPFLSYNKLLKDPKFLKYKKLAGIYIYQRMPVNGKPAAYYIGQAKAGRLVDRFREHANARTGDSLLLHLAIDKYTIVKFKIAIIEFCPEASDVDLDEKEKDWIETFNTFVDRNDYNATPGGDGGVHYKLIPNTEPFNYVIKLLKESDYSNTEIVELLKEKYSIEVDRTLIGKLNRLLEIRSDKRVAECKAAADRRKTKAKRQENGTAFTLYCKEPKNGNVECLGSFLLKRLASNCMFKHEEEVYGCTYSEDFKEKCSSTKIKGKTTFISQNYIYLPNNSEGSKDPNNRLYWLERINN